MKKTFITTITEHSDSFLAVCRIVASAGASITRASYDQALDARTLFMDVAGTEAQLEEVAERLRAAGFMPDLRSAARVALLEFTLHDLPGAALPVLGLIERRGFSASFIDSREDDSGFQSFRIGLRIEDPKALEHFLGEISAWCEVRMIDCGPLERAMDNTVFYAGFADAAARKLGLDRGRTDALLAASNRIAQRLDRLNHSPHQTFGVIGRFVDMMAACAGKRFAPRVTRTALRGGVCAAPDRAALRRQHLYPGKGRQPAVHRHRLCLLRPGDARGAPAPFPRIRPDAPRLRRHPPGHGPLRAAGPV